MSFLFSFSKSENRKAEQALWVGAGREFDTSEKGEEVGKGFQRVNMVQILCTH
jgi:hypothetical protein